jgi:hypothetical protein
MQELASYLVETHNCWQNMTGNNAKLLDPRTVELLEGRCPRLSEADRRHINHIFEQYQAFPSVRDSHIRSRLQTASMEYPRIIPSLKTFLENTKYLKPMTDVMKIVFRPKLNDTIRQTMRRFYHAQNSKIQIQVSENDFEDAENSNVRYGFWSASRQMFLFAMRHFWGLTDVHPRGYSQFTKSRQPFDKQELWSRSQFLARNLGFIPPGAKTKIRGNEQEKSLETEGPFGKSWPVSALQNYLNMTNPLWLSVANLLSFWCG